MKPLKAKIILSIVSGLGIGFSPVIPGTLGTLWAIPFFYLNGIAIRQ